MVSNSLIEKLEKFARLTPGPFKFLPAITVAYVLCPIDAIPDFVPGFGQLDDLTVVLIALLLIAIALIGYAIAQYGNQVISSALLCLAISFHQPGVSKAEPISAPSTSDKPTQDTAIPPSDQPNKPVNRFSITLSSAFDLADRNNPELLATLKNMDMARAQLKTAAAIPNPQLAIQAGFGNPYTKVISGNTQQVGANQLIELGGKRSARMNLAKANLDLTAKQLEAQRFEIRCRVRKAYAELAAAEANIELVENQRGLIERLHKIAARRAMAGAAPASEEIQAQLALDQFDALRTSALARLRQASIQLDYLLGYKPERDLDVEDNGLFKLSAKKNELVPQPDYDFPPIEELLKQAYMQRLDLKASELQTAAGVQAFKLARKQAIPDLLLGSGYVFSTFAVSQHAPFQQGAYLNANVDIPIFYRHQGEIAQAKAQIEQARLQVSAKKAQIETDVHAAYTELMAARSNIKNFRETLIPRARDVVRMSQRSYEVGRSDLSNAIIAEQSFQQTLSGYFDAVVAYQNAWADLEKAIGAPVKH